MTKAKEYLIKIFVAIVLIFMVYSSYDSAEKQEEWRAEQAKQAAQHEAFFHDMRDFAGKGAREVTIQGIDATGAEVSDVLATAGTSASSASTSSYIRLYRMWVSSSGTYSTSAAGSHADDIVIENSAGTADWGTIDSTDYPRGQSEIACYTIPTGYTGYVSMIKIQTDSTKVTKAILFKREGAVDDSTPYDAMRMQIEMGGIVGTLPPLIPEEPYGPYPAGTDLIWMASVSVGSGEVDIDFEIKLVSDNANANIYE